MKITQKHRLNICKKLAVCSGTNLSCLRTWQCCRNNIHVLLQKIYVHIYSMINLFLPNVNFVNRVCGVFTTQRQHQHTAGACHTQMTWSLRHRPLSPWLHSFHMKAVQPLPERLVTVPCRAAQSGGLGGLVLRRPKQMTRWIVKSVFSIENF